MTTKQQRRELRKLAESLTKPPKQSWAMQSDFPIPALGALFKDVFASSQRKAQVGRARRKRSKA
jgi:hypothetical protein